MYREANDKEAAVLISVDFRFILMIREFDKLWNPGYHGHVAAICVGRIETCLCRWLWFIANWFNSIIYFHSFGSIYVSHRVNNVSSIYKHVCEKISFCDIFFMQKSRDMRYSDFEGFLTPELKNQTKMLIYRKF